MNLARFRSVLGLALSLFVAAAAPDAFGHSGNSVEGVLYHLVGDPNPRVAGGRTNRILYVESEDDGHRVPVDLSAAQLPAGGVAEALNKRVRVTTTAGTRMQDMARNDSVRATRLEILSPRRVIGNDVFPMSGSRKYMSLLCKYNGDATEPRTPAFFATQLGNTYPGFDHYFQEVSYGRANINGSTALGSWVTMAHAQDFFDTDNPNASLYLFPMAQECVNAAEAIGTSFAGVVGINLMFNGLVDDCCAWGGSGSLVLDGVSRGVSLTWMPYWGTLFPGETFGWLDHGVLGHELSHSFGSPHSGDPSGFQYGNFWDVVSKPGGTCATVDPTYGCVSQHPVGDNKLKMDFIAPARIATHAIGAASTTYTIERLASPPNAGGTFQLVKVLTPNSHKYYTIEARKRTGYDVNIPGDGVLILDVIDNRPFVSGTNPGDDARLLTPTGSTAANTGDIDSRWSAGNVYLNATDNVKITVLTFDAGTGTATVKVEPATAPGEYSFGAPTYQVSEGGPVLNIPVTRTAPFTASGSVTWTTANGTAIAGTDFGAAGNPAQRTGTLTWTAGTGGVKNITVGLSTSNIPVINEGAAESAETFGIALSTPVGGTLGAQSATTVTVNDGAVIGFAAPTSNAVEAGSNVAVELVRSGDTSVAHNVTFMTVAGSGAVFATATSDYTTTTGTVTFAVGETSKTIAVGPNVVPTPFVRIVNDSTIEGPETFTIRLTTTTNGAVAPLATRDNVVTIASDENGVAMVAPTATHGEGAGTVGVMVNRSGGVGAVSVNYAFVNGTALNGTHYNGVGGTLNWADGETGQKEIEVEIVNDGAANAARTFTVSLSGATGATLVTPSTLVTITDNENGVQFSSPTATVTEGTASVMLTVTRTGDATGGAADVNWSIADGTALTGVDYGGPTSGTLHWNQFETASKTITIPILNDVLAEGAKTFTVTLDTPSGPNVAIGTNATATVTINDNDKGMKWELASYSVNENASPLSVTLRVQRVGPTNTAMTASWATTNGTATAGQDFGLAGNAAQRTGAISWAINDGAMKNVVIPILNDTLGGEGPETFNVTLTPGAGAALAGPATVQVTINDDDIPPQSTAQFSAPKYMVIEGNSPVVAQATLTVNRVILPGGGFGLPASVNYSMSPGSALATSDYTAGTGTLTWAAGNADPKTITVNITSNTLAEPPESFRVLLAGASPGLGIATPEATVLILDDDEPFPLDGVMPAGFSTPVDTTAGWHVSTDPGAYNGFFSLKNDAIDDGQTAGLEMTGTFAAGNVIIYVKVSTEPTFDKLEFFIDGVLKGTWSGTANAAWQVGTYPILAGPHTLRWVYTKDGSVSVGMDAVYLDGVMTPAFTPAP